MIVTSTKRYILCIVVWLVWLSDVRADDVKFFFSGMDDTRQSLISGVCRVRGTTIQKITKSGEIKSTVEDCFIAFDYSKNLYRFDRVGIGKSLRTPDYLYSRLDQLGSGSTISRRPSSDGTGTRINAFDILSLGFFSLYGNFSNSQYRPRGLANDYSNFIVEKVSGLIKITYTSDKKNIKPGDPIPVDYSIYLDPQNKFTTKIIELYSQRSEISWKQINNTYVPIAFSGRVGYLIETPVTIDADWTFDWELVNEKVPEHYFQVNDFLQKGESADVMSWELGRDTPIRVERVGVMSDIPLTNERGIITKYVLIISGIILIVISLGKKFYDWRKSQTSE